ncbi:hypothetical protein JXQ31_12195 [candidate division KSB1 bacterium]|nr:hypothetical protein [candidate division KSB1 bacterium]
MDERYKIHRLYSTRLAAMVTAVALGGWFLYLFYAKSVYRWDLFIIMCLMAVTKLGAMFYYRKTN